MRSRRQQLVRDGAVLFLTVELLIGGFSLDPLLISVVVGAAVGALWIPLAGRRLLRLQLGAPLTAMPAFLALQAGLHGGSSGGLLGRICGAAMIGLLAIWIGSTRDRPLAEA